MNQPIAKLKIDLKMTSRIELISNTILVVRYICNVIFNHYELVGRDQDLVAINLYFVAFGFLLFSAVIELLLDIFATRVVRHGCYCSSSFWNIVISFLFINVGSFDVVAFIFWEDK